VRLLLDAHTLLWWLAKDPGLKQRARNAIADQDNEVLVSAAIVWEISTKAAIGRLEAAPDLIDELVPQVDAEGFAPLSISLVHAYAAGRLPRHHRDPFDRILVAQALLEQLTIVTRDPLIARYDVPILEA
jgi:PIN domain nuclease of toxin-antitoxin system